MVVVIVAIIVMMMAVMMTTAVLPSPAWGTPSGQIQAIHGSRRQTCHAWGRQPPGLEGSGRLLLTGLADSRKASSSPSDVLQVTLFPIPTPNLPPAPAQILSIMLTAPSANRQSGMTANVFQVVHAQAAVRSLKSHAWPPVISRTLCNTPISHQGTKKCKEPAHVYTAGNHCNQVLNTLFSW